MFTDTHAHLNRLDLEKYEGDIRQALQAAKDANYPMTLRMQDGYDHSYYFISSFIADHFAHHAAALQA